MLNSHIFSSIDDAYNYIVNAGQIDSSDLIIVENTHNSNTDIHVGVYENFNTYIYSYYGDNFTKSYFNAAVYNASSFKYRNSKDMNTIKEYINNSNITHDDSVKLEDIVSKYNNAKVPIQVEKDIIDTIRSSSNVNTDYINKEPHTSYLNF